MNPEISAIGTALMCNQDSVVLKVLHNDLGITESEILGKAFPMLVARSSFQKALSFLVELRTKRTVFDWEFDIHTGDKVILAHCAGLAIEDGLLIMAAQTCSEVHHLFEEMISINNGQTNLLRTITKTQIELIRAQPEREIRLYEELSSVNNELVTLQRELAKKNAELKRLNAEVRRLSIEDELTHIYNRRGFFEIGIREVARVRRFGKHLSAIMFDVDHFSRINNTYGHATGDKVLAEITARCNCQLRKVDILGRYGGDKFSVLLPETKIANARIIAERLNRHVSNEPISTEHGPLTVTISLGVSALKGNITELEELLEYADKALYQAKESGRNRVCVDGE